MAGNNGFSSLAIDPVAQRVYLAVDDGDAVFVVDPETRQPLGLVPCCDFRGTGWLAVNPSTSLL
jgi:DNA-binding beta-propeller fold protein YncE